jgi:hypothetical protein
MTTVKIVEWFDPSLPGRFQVLKTDRDGTWVHAANNDRKLAIEQARILKAELGISEQKYIERRAIGRRGGYSRRQQRGPKRRSAVSP